MTGYNPPSVLSYQPGILQQGLGQATAGKHWAGVQDPTLDLWREALRGASLFYYIVDRKTALHCPIFPLMLACGKTTKCTKKLEDDIVNYSFQGKVKFCKFQTRLIASLKFCLCSKICTKMNWKWKVLSIDLNWINPCQFIVWNWNMLLQFKSASYWVLLSQYFIYFVLNTSRHLSSLFST